MAQQSKPKNIIICYDGTGNEYGPNNTNVVQLFKAIERNPQQVGFYDPGVGTFSSIPYGEKLGILLGKAFGYGLFQNVADGYEYLMNTYQNGDKVFIFGFSRGAFTARKLAALIAKFGVLEKGSRNLIPYVLKMYKNQKTSDQIISDFRHDYCHECKPHFVGVWDTVASLGYIRGRKFNDNILHSDIGCGVHAIAINETRRKFPVSLWAPAASNSKQRIMQAWFAGVHSDVGGWYSERGLSDIALKWMLEQAESEGLQLRQGWTQNLQCDHKEKQHESYVKLWKLLGAKPRKIPEGSMIHQSVLDRINDVSDFKPVLPKNYTVVI
jgi:uncharacterized protein (DUF2235 family)